MKGQADASSEDARLTPLDGDKAEPEDDSAPQGKHDVDDEHLGDEDDE